MDDSIHNAILRLLLRAIADRSDEERDRVFSVLLGLILKEHELRSSRSRQPQPHLNF
jgi:hypothetical protein